MSAGHSRSAFSTGLGFRFVLGFDGFGKASSSFFLARYAFARHAPEQYFAGFPRPDGLNSLPHTRHFITFRLPSRFTNRHVLGFRGDIGPMRRGTCFPDREGIPPLYGDLSEWHTGRWLRLLPPLAGHEPGNLTLRPFERMRSLDCVAPAMRRFGVRPGVWISTSCDWDDLIHDKAPRIWIFESQIDWFPTDRACSSAFDCCFVSGDELVPSRSVLPADVRLMRCHSFVDSVQIQSTTSIPRRCRAARKSSS